MTEWFERWFGDEYLELYPHRDEEDAGRAVDLIASVVPLPGATVLDLACGPGRHAAALAARGAHVVGIDLSMALLRRARHAAPGVDALVRGDMRALPFRAGSFDAVVNLFTSFGYFADDEQHRNVLRGAGALLVPRGTFVIDYLNPTQVRRHLVPAETRRIGRHDVNIARRLIDGGCYVEKTMRLGDGRAFTERVRLFTAEDLTGMLEGAGLRVTQAFGDYDGGPRTDDAPRTVIVAEKP